MKTTTNTATAKTKLGTSKVLLSKKTEHGTIFVSVTARGTSVTFFTYGVGEYSGYTTKIDQCRPLARESFKDLLGKGFAVEAEDRCTWLPTRRTCEDTF